MAQRLAITRRGLTLRPLARPTKDIFFEDLDSASARGARLTLAMRDGERVTLWTRGAKASAAAIQRVLNRGDQALERTTALADLRTEVTAWSQESGFSAPAFVDYILRAATRLEISDLHIKGGVQEASVSVRRNGRLFPVGGIPRGIRVCARVNRCAIPTDPNVLRAGGARVVHGVLVGSVAPIRFAFQTVCARPRSEPCRRVRVM